MRLTWLPTILREYGLRVHEHQGWVERGKDTLDPRVVIIHHTASKPPAVLPSLNVCINGRPDVPGPLCNVLIGRDGVCHVLASGVSNNAGAGGFGSWKSNRYTIGVEVENDGLREPWSDELYATTVLAAAALKDGAGIPVSHVIGHKEWAPKRKIDPSFDMRAFRAAVSVALPERFEVPPSVVEGEIVEYRFPDGRTVGLVPPPRWLIDLGRATVGVAENGNLYVTGEGAPVVEAAIERSGYRTHFTNRTVHQCPEWRDGRLRIVSHLAETYDIPISFPPDPSAAIYRDALEDVQRRISTVLS